MQWSVIRYFNLSKFMVDIEYISKIFLIKGYNSEYKIIVSDITLELVRIGSVKHVSCV